MNVEDEAISAWESKKYVPQPGQPDLPPQLSELAQKTPEEIMTELNRLPFFMSQLDETDGEGGENIGLEALKSLAYDGEPDEIATNFKNQGNECYKFKQYKNAVEYYTKGLDVKCDVDAINVALYINRAACNLELKNYRRCIEDCKRALLLDENNVKACFRAGKAFFCVGRLEEAREILKYGLTKNPDNAPMQELLDQIEAAEKAIEEKKAKKEQAEKDKKLKQELLQNAIKLRHIDMVKTLHPAEYLEDAKIYLEDPTDYQSQLIFPAVVLYPTTNEFDFIAEISELTTPNDILAMVLDRPQSWFEDPKHAKFTIRNLDCYMETTSGGLVKVGKKVAINEALMGEKAKAPLFDNGLRLYVVPKDEAAEWLSKWNKDAALSKRLR
ncbi:putative hsp70 Hsp90 co-chaperone protein [Clavispora lusitaniae]|uniref:HSP70/90 family co-chaperone n=2 Tax=Clavispora lusitaniae TaxID=36911 RepID=A0AA91Q198_CLALS|nr:putative HSP70/90 family co-chaperone [Clavispora lusitaniae]QFZ29120.1 putative hsp70 Hsp90 co-chaperone protein [Clavispora lusitaniae]QFZ34783.1 putative hsp70 Hsp90 co-chaperone protein [Clavispora lusitaniae]QFZ40468.1 putative hsp70 Hsp90 co-chaperone protein [Clavispora lusitaniae]QFZ46148.1 putative hsp70 Hsp90 co-chaperone protein [Clavispora lusitaniae]